jgi:mannose-6-phosphate isomerase
VTALYPLRFEPIYQFRIWGGQRLRQLVNAPLPDGQPVGEAWLLSDRDDHPSVVAEGPLAGRSLRHVLEEFPVQIMGALGGRFARFPLLLKFLDVTGSLSVQVHPSDGANELLPVGDTGKTEAWVVLQVGPEARVFAGLKSFTSGAALLQDIVAGTVADDLASFIPAPGDTVLIPAGAVHSLRDVVVFEVQQNSDVTFRLYDWGHIDPTTGQPRKLQVDQAMACIDFRQGAIRPLAARVQQIEPVLSESLVQCDQFGVTRLQGDTAFSVGSLMQPRVIVCLSGSGHLANGDAVYPFHQGDVLLLPAIIGACSCRPQGPMSVLEVSLPPGLLKT